MTDLQDLPLRDSLRGQTPYGAPQLDVPIALNVNENTHGVHPEVQKQILAALSDELSGLNRYPDREFRPLREALADYLGDGLSADNIWAANGSNEVLQHILQAFAGPGRSVLSFGPTYSMYPLLAAGTDSEYIEIPREEGFLLSPEFVAAKIAQHKPDVVLLCGPNNPTGTTLSREAIIAAYDAFDGVLVIDEAYHEFETDLPSATTLLNGRPRLAVSRTTSKAFAFAGVRLGYLAADPAFIDALRLVRLPYHLSALTQAAALTAVRNAPLMLEAVAEIRAQRALVVAELQSLGLRPWQSGANFLLIDGFDNPSAVFDALLDRGILVRKVAIPGHLRLTIGTAAENKAVLAALRDILK
ncbi:histidinol-phosphate transaminase [Canibacter zhoujuaniae]|uniref:histidinol-phosphate transaminase n=1 Tax=Canibacter zhoujuaniae TaxID=2708343 RepID=UPI0014235065|nr:histidinol-phosphate transaminase [Canibacter zhoujuaniae]